MITGQSSTATLLFTDLVNSTEHLQRAGDETGQRLFQAHHKLISEAMPAPAEKSWSGWGMARWRCFRRRPTPYVVR
jgi:hypothetical protein